MKPMPAIVARQYVRLARLAGVVPPLQALIGVGVALMALTLVTPFAFRAGGDNAFLALGIAAALLTIAATCLAERIPSGRALWLIFGVAILLRAYVLLFDPLL